MTKPTKQIKNGYLCIQDYYGIGKSAYVHRLVMEQKLGRPLLRSEQVDHIDGDRLNNSPDNLRLATHSQNQHNRTKQHNNKSGFKGVSFHTKAGKWVSWISALGKRHYLGLYDSPQLAAEAYRTASLELHGEFARQ